MGSCVSVHKGASDSTMKMRVTFGSNTDKLVIPESPIKDKPATVDLSNKTFEEFGSKDETFFDSRPWLDSDCEDDFYSVNGDFTPSRGNTPVHHRFSVGTPKVNKTLEETSPVFVPEPSPTGKKKRLCELFQESPIEEPINGAPSSGIQNIANEKTGVKATILDVLPKSANTTPFISGSNSVCSSERTPNGHALLEKDKSQKSVECCLPSLISCRSFSERKKKMSPAVAVNGKT
ncbi:hypothetical protein K2173_014234 [Erythroxylum novogranatense]|uniref:Uncharacterized protein n=1 Tax=Erythroxylum novogranatense TaxID=1862640 RepID=A0AAV8SE80_9ROSI|nr:hypothetical protein K2173_014234 [Erythroxylum novogranatense]